MSHGCVGPARKAARAASNRLAEGARHRHRIAGLPDGGVEENYGDAAALTFYWTRPLLCLLCADATLTCEPHNPRAASHEPAATLPRKYSCHAPVRKPDCYVAGAEAKE